MITAARAGRRATAQASSGASASYRRAIACIFLVSLFVAGGASRADEPRQMVVRAAAVILLAASLWPLERPRINLDKAWLFTGLAASLIALQLVPLPPAWWSRLPGHGVYAQIAVAAQATGWRPASLTPDLTLNSLLALLPAGAAIAIAGFLDLRGRERLWLWLVGAALLSAALGVAQLAGGGSSLRVYHETSADSAVGLFANRNHQAAFLACSLPLLGAVLGHQSMKAPGPRLLAVGLAAAALLEIGILATASRSGLLLGCAGALAGLVTLRQEGGRLSSHAGRAKWPMLAGAGALVAIGVLAAAQFGVAQRLAQTDPASEMRVAILGPLVHTARAFFPLGAGFGSFETVYRQFEPDSLLSTVYLNQAHDELLQLAIEGGIPALVLLAAFLWWWCTTALRLWRATLPPRRRAMAFSSIAVTAMLMAESLVDYPLRTPMLGALFAIACVEMSRAVAVAARPSAAGQIGAA